MGDSSCNDEKLLLSKASDTIELSHRRFAPCYLGFLNEHQAQYIKDNLYLDDACMFWGGYNDAQRVVFGSNVDSPDEFPIRAVKFIFKKEYELSHRDFLGALMALGIERKSVGDILTFDGEAIVFLKSEIADYVLSEITKIGRIGVRVTEQEFTEINYTPDLEELRFTVSSLRLDVFVSAVCKLSREQSLRLVKSDMVSVNHNVEDNPSRVLRESDVITIRKFGKFVFAENCGLSKKGKCKISVKHFR